MSDSELSDAAPWRSDPAIAPFLHPEYPDDVQVLVHDGEPRRTRRPPEGCWVRIVGVDGVLEAPTASRASNAPVGSSDGRVERTVYRATLLNQPHGLETVRQGDELLFLAAPGLPLPLQVTEQYLAERVDWAFTPCNRCGADQALDPPTVMARTRFPDAPEGSVPIAFTAFCTCGGTMVVAQLDDGAPTASPEPTPTAERKPWWKLW